MEKQSGFPIEPILWAVAPFLGLLLLRSVAPLRRGDIRTSKSLTELQAAYRHVFFADGWLTFMVGIAASFALFKAFTIAKLLTSPVPTTSLAVFLPGTLYWLLPSGLLGFGLASVTASFAVKKYLGNQHDEYLDLVNLQAGGNSARFTRWAVALGAILGIVPLFGGMNGIVVVDESGLSIRDCFSLSIRKYGYDQVSKISAVQLFRAPSGKLIPRPRYIINFSDGTDWSTEDLLRDTDLALDSQIIQEIALRSAKSIEPLDVSSRE